MNTIAQRPIVAAPMSFTGATERIVQRVLLPAVRAIRNVRPAGPPWVQWLIKAGALTGTGLVWLFGAYVLLAVWLAVTCWYVLIFGVFGLLVIPWRIWRRGHRTAEAQRAEIIALLAPPPQQPDPAPSRSPWAVQVPSDPTPAWLQRRKARH